MRVFDDGTSLAPIWVEFETDKFWCGNDESDARDHYESSVTTGVSLARLREAFGERLREYVPGELRTKGKA